jgi:alpha-2-macroglobulin
MKHFLLLITYISILATVASAQDLTRSRQTSYFTFIYKISDAEARMFYKNSTLPSEKELSRTVVDSFPHDSTYRRELPVGHYLFAFTQGNQLQYELETIANRELKILNNKTDLALVVLDSLGKPIENAEIHLKNRRIPFDKKYQTYRLAKTNQSGLLAIDYQGFTSYHQINKQLKNSRFKRIKNAILFNPPLKYVLYPFYWVNWRIRDIVRTVKFGRPEGFIRTIGSIFDPDLRRTRVKLYRGYMAFNKPMYLPKDTIKMKVFALNPKGKPVTEELELWLWSYQTKAIQLTKLKPYQSGAYEYQFILDDSLNLRLDNNYNLTLYTKGRKSTVMSNSFRYEDYELKENKFSLRASKEKAGLRGEEAYFTGEPITLYAQGKDANDLNLLDARVRVHLLAQNPQFRKGKLFVKDTLWLYEQNLEPLGETKIIVPDSLLLPIDLNIKVLAEFYNASNERQTKELTLKYEHQPEQVRLNLQNDTLIAEYWRNGKPEKPQSDWEIYLKNYHPESGDLVFQQKIQLPYRGKLNSYTTDYKVVMKKGGKSLSDYLRLEDYPSDLQCYSNRTRDSVQITVDNPRRIPFWYTIYRKNKVIEKGQATELNFKIQNTTWEKYFLSLQYLWANEVKELDYEIPLFTRNLEILVNQPTLIEPGQKTEIEIEVKDFEQKPASDVDLTAYAFTKKFTNPNIPTLPSLEKRRKNRKYYNKFSEDTDIEDVRRIPLNWDFWNSEMRLDSIEYYKFLYPQTGVYWQSRANPDSLTQFAPFVVNKGQVEPVQIIYVDEVPIFFRVNNTLSRYSFPIDNGYHSIKLRTANHLVKIDSFYFAKNKKTWLSVRVDSSYRKITTTPQKNTWQTHELTQLDNYMLPVRRTFGNAWAYLQQGERLHLFNNIFDYNAYNQGNYGRTTTYRRNSDYQSYYLAGPFRPGFLVEFNLIQDFYTRFEFESGFEYDFKKELLKMRTLKPSSLIDIKRFNTQSKDSFLDNALTIKEIDTLFKRYKQEREFYYEVFENPQTTDAGFGRVRYEYVQAKKPPHALKYVMILKPGISDFVRVYAPKTSVLHQIPEGQYRMIFLLANGFYVTQDSVEVKKDGINYYRWEEKNLQKPDSFSLKTLKIIREKYLKLTKDTLDLLNIKKQYNQQTQVIVPSNFNNYVNGKVLDKQTGEGIPGVSVFVKGSAVGTVTDVEGYYELNVPSGAVLVFQAVGYITTEVQANNSRIDVSLNQDVKALNEVVVVGYGVQERRELTGAVATVSSNQVLQGRIAGVNISVLDSAKIVMARYASDYGFISDQNLQEKPDNQTLSESGLPGIATTNALRRNFSDYAYWQPKLRTDRQGKARFSVTFPDDITNWRTVVLAMDAHKRTGQTQGEIKAYKSVSGNLAVPRFLVIGDSTQIIGKAFNYSSDTLAIQTAFVVAGKEQEPHNQRLITSVIDSMWVNAATADSLEIKYFLRKQDGYTDGEIRNIPVYPQGVEETEGKFYALDRDTVLNLQFSDKYAQVKLYAQADVLEVILNETRQLRNYKYLCNEQTASKIKALLAEKQIYAYLQKRFPYERDIRYLINKLEKNQKAEGGWGWWESTEFSNWVSIHVAEALVQAQKAGYMVNFNRQKLQDYLIYQVENYNLAEKYNFGEKLRSLQLLHTWQVKVDYEKYINELEKISKLTLHEKLSLWLLRQKQNLPFSMDSLLKYRKQTLFGNQYWGELNYDWYDNSVQNTLLAYQILKLKGNSEADLRKIRNYFFEIRKNGCWRNTYESAQIVSVILGDLLGNKKELTKPQLVLSGAINQTIDKFPFEAQLANNQTITVKKTGDFPIYFTAYQSFWNEKPEKVEKDFIVNTYFDTKTNQLKAGKPVKLKIELEVKKTAEYLMLEVPIPAGCSYDSKKQSYYWGGSQHREYFREKTNFYFTKLNVGKYTYEIELLPRYSGKYTLNPAKIEQMYFPTFFGRNELRKVVIR